VVADVPEVLTVLFLLIGLVGGLACGLFGAAMGRVLGTVLRTTPVVAWLIVLACTAPDGLTDTEYRALGRALLGVLVGLFTSQLVRRRRGGAHR
jgi:hypothetical protein